MRIFAKQPQATQPTAFAKSMMSGRTHLQSQRTGGKPERDSETGRFSHDFSGVPAHARTPMSLQSGAQSLDGLAHDTFGFGPPRIFPIPAPEAAPRSSPTMPIAGGGEEDIFEPPQTGGGNAAPGSPAPSAPAPAAGSCSKPRSMNKIVSGSFLGGLTMDSYFPDLSGGGFWAHAGTGGPFDTGTQAGGNAQLFGVIPSPCVPSQFHLEQTASPVRFRVGGVAQPLEGTTFDDVARSGRNFSQAPSRQEFFGGGAAPLGFIISMADPPSVSYNSSRPNVERDTNFVSSLVGPGGRQSVSWSQSVRVVGGVVSVNTLT
jgi:hypothetical protein